MIDLVGISLGRRCESFGTDQRTLASRSTEPNPGSAKKRAKIIAEPKGQSGFWAVYRPESILVARLGTLAGLSR